jgi:DNA processing protein
MEQYSLDFSDLSKTPVSPYLELGAYEALWDDKGATFKRLAEKFRTASSSLPSQLVDGCVAEHYAEQVDGMIREAGVDKYGVRVFGAGDYPHQLRDAEYPVELLYFQGWWDLVFSPRMVAVVGTRSPSSEGIKRTRQLVRKLVEDGFTIVSGLAKGIDTVAHETAIEEGGKTISVIGTPITRHYPSENAELQRKIAGEHLLISQVPVKRYERATSPTHNNIFFPERNKTMSALTQATIIVEAGETSGTLVQARAALKQKRKLFILDSCFLNPSISWPKKFEELGAIRVRSYEDVRSSLAPNALH